MQYKLITEQNELDNVISSYAKKPLLAIDTEFMRRRTLYPELALLQVYDGDVISLIDPLCELDLTAFWQLMTNENIIKVLHSPSEDLEVFLKHGNCVPTPLFDTQFALSLLGERNCVGFANMVEMLLNKQIDKSESRTNWMQRPLTLSQLDYAAADVFYLLPCYNAIKNKLTSQQIEIVESESKLLARKRAYSAPSSLAYLDIKNSWQLNSQQLSILRELAAWRKERAEFKNLALNFIVKEQIIFDIAKYAPTHFGALKRLCQNDQALLNRYGKVILKLVQVGLDIEPDEQPKKIKRLIDFKGYKRALKDIRAQLVLVSEQNNVPLEVIASKKQMNQIISWKWKETEESRKVVLKPDLLTGWRGEMTKDHLKDWY